ncbi:hypothetical protein LAJ19_14645 (plasmid) [Deinococcus taeanensis]|uniref:hypothetical protein n=1 Tax=Deinococcus taeanensis TaxID=2737050 RepID=UPI001CDC5282|nr:hypothetical protein [Deinococcus taeanensis]UBV44401.1 hypothetical protein LAJ19_14645 [Deinococcus taeanensis]
MLAHAPTHPTCRWTDAGGARVTDGSAQGNLLARSLHVHDGPSEELASRLAGASS